MKGGGRPDSIVAATDKDEASYAYQRGLGIMTRTKNFVATVAGTALILGCSGSEPGGAGPITTSGGSDTSSAGRSAAGAGTGMIPGPATSGGTGSIPALGGGGVGGGLPESGGQGSVAGGGVGGSSYTPPADAKCYKIMARSGAAGAKYTVPTTPDFYHCFNYMPPWGDKKVQVVSARPIIDNSRVIHHWILYNTTSAVMDGTDGTCSHPGATFITGWAPGGQPMEMPDDVGLGVDGAGFTLETHYNNKVGEGEQDASGVELCVTEKLRPNEAAVHWLGTANLNKLEATGTCTPTNKVPVTILGSSPHMHLQGRHMKTLIQRKDGTTETLIDKAFDFNTQISYPTPTVINPGDTLTTTCTYATPTAFGEGTNNEMCFNFVTAYPAGQLVNAVPLFSKNDCTSF